MILLSSIIKAEYVLYENKDEVEKSAITQISSSKEELYEIYNQREIIIKDATEEALKIVNTAKRNAHLEVSEIKNRAYEDGYNAGIGIGKNKGYEEGYQTGLKTIREELSKENEIRLNEINNMIELIEKNKQVIISKYENEISKLAIDIAEKIVRQKIEQKDDFVTKIIENVIEDYKNVEWIKIYVSDNEDARMIEADKLLIDELSKISKDIKIEVKKGLSNRSCIVETPDSIVDASVDTQLNNLKEILLSK
nr:FliH/SctL family protein [Sedimentibacter sp.]